MLDIDNIAEEASGCAFFLTQRILLGCVRTESLTDFMQKTVGKDHTLTELSFKIYISSDVTTLDTHAFLLNHLFDFLANHRNPKFVFRLLEKDISASDDFFDQALLSSTKDTDHKSQKEAILEINSLIKDYNGIQNASLRGERIVKKVKNMSLGKEEFFGGLQKFLTERLAVVEQIVDQAEKITHQKVTSYMAPASSNRKSSPN